MNQFNSSIIDQRKFNLSFLATINDLPSALTSKNLPALVSIVIHWPGTKWTSPDGMPWALTAKALLILASIVVQLSGIKQRASLTVWAIVSIVSFWKVNPLWAWDLERTRLAFFTLTIGLILVIFKPPLQWYFMCIINT